jgi:hypothetical protein
MSPKPASPASSTTFHLPLQPLSAATLAASGQNQFLIRDLTFVQQRGRTAAPVRVGRVSLCSMGWSPHASGGCRTRGVSFRAPSTTAFVV